MLLGHDVDASATGLDSEPSNRLPGERAAVLAAPLTTETDASRLRDRVPAPLVAAYALTLAFHGSLLAAGSYRRTFDAFVHLFFADHYRRDWFSTWEPRWYTGFSTVTYPPGTHQLLAVASRLVGMDRAFPLVALVGLLILVTGVYRFSALWVDPGSAGWAALLVAVSSGVAETVHVFGQLPTITSLGLLLNGIAFADRWVERGRPADLLSAWIFSAATTAAHHVTTLFGAVFFVAPALVAALFRAVRTPLADEPSGHAVRMSMRLFIPLAARRLRRVLRPTLRAGVFTVCHVIALVTVVLPYWLSSKKDPITQIPIPHASRDSFLANPDAGLLFFVIPWGLLLLLLPSSLRRGLFSRNWPLAGSVVLLAILGTGGTTPLPRMLLGGAFDVLTLDRFAFWSTIAVLPLAGQTVTSFLQGTTRASVVRRIGPHGISLVTAVLGTSFLGFATFSANLSEYRPMQPPAIDPTPVLEFLEKDQHWRWRYLGLGLGDQMAWISAQTTAQTVDGNYHSARRLPELTTTPVERLEGAKYTGVAGIGSLQQFLAFPEKYHLKYVFSNDQFYDPLLSASGWQRLEPLRNGLAVWRREDVSPMPAPGPPPDTPMWQRRLWGTLPPTALLAAYLVLAGTAARLVLGRPTLWRPVPQVRFTPSPLRSIEKRLALLALTIPPSGVTPRSAGVVARLHRARRWVERRRPRPSRVRRRVLWCVTLAIVGVIVCRRAAPTPPGPESTVYAYYDAIDLRKLPAAHALLDPATGPTYRQFLTEQSVINGLARSYARLESLVDTRVRVDRDRAYVSTTLRYITALSRFDVRTSEELRLVDGRWRLRSKAPDLAIPPDQIVSRPAIKLLGQGRRQPTDRVTAYADIVDRPELALHPTRLVERGGRLSIVGELTNIDVDIAHVTVTATLKDRAGRKLTSYTNAVGSMHTALPGETISFRVDFEGVAGLDGTRKVEFEPGAWTNPDIDERDIASVDVEAKAIAIGESTTRDVAVVAVPEVDADRRTSLAVRLRNDGTDEKTVSHLFVTLRDADGSVGWIDDAFSPLAIRPQRSVEFDVSLTAPRDVRRIDVPIQLFANAVDNATAERPPALLGAVGGWASADAAVESFVRSPR